MTPNEIKKLTIDTLDHGRAKATLDAEIELAVADIVKRPQVKKPRRVTLTIEIASNPDQSGDYNMPAIAYAVGKKLPDVKGTATTGFLDPHGELMVNVNDPLGREPHQPTMFAASGQVIGLGEGK